VLDAGTAEVLLTAGLQVAIGHLAAGIADDFSNVA
jgi:hypothetical protein